jgi:hypothetical protein
LFNYHFIDEFEGFSGEQSEREAITVSSLSATKSTAFFAIPLNDEFSISEFNIS